MFLLLAAPSAPAEVTALHMSSGGLPWEPGRAPPQCRDPQLGLPRWPTPPGKQQGRARWGHPVQMAHEVGAQHGAALGQRRGEGAGGPKCDASPICSLHLSLSRDGFQLLLLALRRQQHSHPLGTHCIFPVPVPSRGCQGCPVQPQLLSVPLPVCWCCSLPQRCHAKAVGCHPVMSLLCCRPARLGHQWRSGRVH